MNKASIKAALLKGEKVTLECKRAKAEVPKSVWETYSAFANTIGGLILLGVDKDLKEKNPKKRYQIMGVDDPQKIVTDFWNPGLLRVPIEQIYEGGVSYARNPKIQNMLRMVGYGENLGSGFPLILNAWKQAGWNLPELKNKIDLDEVELVLPVDRVEESSEKSTLKNSEESTLKSIEESMQKNTESMQKSTLKSMQKSTLKSTQKSTLKGTQKNIVEIIMQNPNVTIPQVAKQLNLNPRGIARHFKVLQDKGIIRRVGPDKGGHWEIIKE